MNAPMLCTIPQGNIIYLLDNHMTYSNGCADESIFEYFGFILPIGLEIIVINCPTITNVTPK
jgi:hypothetical protein